ncbi:MAG: DUF2079 domain-containing protein [Anaerolineae bacterium]|nr:DUF2079 domain-containing protein [Anaerolineae bacterium]
MGQESTSRITNHESRFTDHVSRITQPHSQSWLALGIVGLLIVLYIAVFSALAVARHEAFETLAYDLGNYDQAVWNTSHGRLLRFTNVKGLTIRLAQHVEPILLPVSLFYLIYSSPKTLLVLQTVVVALGAWPVYLLAREKLQSEFGGIVFALAYLLLPALEAANLFDFHAVTLAPTFLLWAFYFLEKGKAPWFIVFSVLAMSCKEEMSLLIGMMALYALLLRKRKKLGAAMIVVAAIWFYVAVYIVIPWANPQGKSQYLGYYEDWGDNHLEIALTMIRQRAWWLIFKKDNLDYLFRLLLPLAFLPVFYLPILLIALPSLAINLLSGNMLMHRPEMFHYAGPIVPFAILAAIWGAGFLVQHLGRRMPGGGKSLSYLLPCVVLVCSLGYHRYRGFSPLSVRFRWPVVTEHHRLAQQLIDQIPPAASLSAQLNLNPHVSHREKLYIFPNIEDAEYIFLDAASMGNKDDVNTWVKEQFLENGPFGIVAAQDGYLLLQRGAEPDAPPDSFYTFVRVRNPDIQYPLLTHFGSSIEFLGFDVIYDRDLESFYNLYLRTSQPLDTDYFIALYLVDEAGQVVGSTVEPQAAMIWHPTSHWQPGEVVKIRADTLSWWTGDREQYSVALGILDGNDTWDVGRRLRPSVVESHWQNPMPADGTLLQLMTFRNTWEGAKPMLRERRFTVPDIEHPMEVTLGDQVRFLGYALSPPPYKRGETLHLTLYWQAMTRIDESYIVFVHLLDKNEMIGGQWDSVPGGGLLPTTSWLEGEVIADEYKVPIRVGAPPGEYVIEIGMYDVYTGERLKVWGEGGDAEGNRIVLHKIQIPRGKE